MIDTYTSVAFAKVYDNKTSVTAADALNDRVPPFFEDHDLKVLRVLTDRGTEYCGRDDSHPYQIFLGLNEIEHTKTKTKHPQTNGICERFNQTCLSEFYLRAFRKKIYRPMEVLQQDLDNFVLAYDHVRTHQGKRCQGRTLGQTFTDSLPQARAHHIREPAKAPTTESSPISSSESTTAGAAANQQASAK